MPYFDKIILSEDAGINKPHPDMFTYALKNTNSKRNQTIMIGDSWDADIVGAHNSRYRTNMAESCRRSTAGI